MDTAAAAKLAKRPHREMKILCLGLPRTGTLSMAEALEILGYQNVFHSLREPDVDAHAALFNRAADASFSTLKTYKENSVVTREDWDTVFGASEAATEVASLFGPQLVKVYPDAKVILVIRDFDAWYQSIDKAVLRGLWGSVANFFASYVQPLIGVSTIASTRKVVLGFFEASSVDEVRDNARAVYDRHHRQIRELVPPENLLVYRLGCGWRPLCEFLGKKVPSRDFPRVNEAEELKAHAWSYMKRQLIEAGKVLFVPRLDYLLWATASAWGHLR